MSEVVSLHKKVTITFGIRCFYSIPHSTEKGKYWLLTGGRKGIMVLWGLQIEEDEETPNISIQLIKELLPRKEIQNEVVIKYLEPPNDWSCWNPETLKNGYKELIVLLVARRRLEQGCSLMSLQLNPENGKIKIESKKFYHLNGVSRIIKHI